jgi:hypothetical protein
VALLEGVGSVAVVAWLPKNWRAVCFLSNVFLFSGVSMIGELGGLLALQSSSSRCNRLRLSQRQDGGLLLLSLLRTWIAARPADWLRVCMVVVVEGELLLDSMCRMRWLLLVWDNEMLWFVNRVDDGERRSARSTYRLQLMSNFFLVNDHDDANELSD